MSRDLKGKNNPMFGRKHSEETKQKMRKSQTGRKHSKKTKKKISESNKGKIISEEQKKKLRKINKGKIVSKETKKKMSESHKGKNNHMYGKTHSIESRKKMSKRKFGIIHSKESRDKMSLSSKTTITQYKEKRPLFSKIEEMRYNPDKPNEKEIQVHCKNHNCPNSKEQGGWFTPTFNQISERIKAIENSRGFGESNFYCCNECKDSCPIFNLRYDPLKNTEIQYTEAEYKTFRLFVLERDNYICQYCGEEAIIVHHERPQKLEPFFALDPDYAWSCCEKCHYEKGHQDECSTGNLANKICI